ncbi:hypothetical protein ED733_007173 [Metarhizium rileyi]|uniref:Major facilitator superfamily (MFS) profile domain-containing protein n=1 Tax=Metarhizium rileyi (strain RCEF 4871) TaxID=1649241 RepID=A0A5C6GGN5_METRR|nr:hypothetical protein ED733_007173 [Metarhizium rileyi]
MSRCYTTDDGDTLNHRRPAPSALYGAAECLHLNHPIVIISDVASSSQSQETWSSSQQSWMLDSPAASTSLQSDYSIVEPKEFDIKHPDGGSRAWLVVAGGFIVFMFTFGILNAFGTFQDLCTDDVSEIYPWIHPKSGEISWTGSIQLCISLCGGLVSGPMFDKWGARMPMFAGTLFCSVSFLVAGYSDNFRLCFVFQGIPFGLGVALLYYPAIGAITVWFTEKRSLALGMSAAGSSLGGIIWSTLVPALHKKLWHGGPYQVITSIAAPLLLLGCYLVQERKEMAGHDDSRDQVQPSKRSIQKAVFDLRFLALSCTLFVLYTSVLIPFSFMTVNAKDLEASENITHTLVTYTYASSFLGRVGTGLLADKFGW